METTPLSDAQLRETYELMRQRHRQWPNSFEAVMADPQRSRLVRINAMVRSRALAKRACTTQRAVPTVRPLPALRPGTTPVFDRKRAAAGDREDD